MFRLSHFGVLLLGLNIALPIAAQSDAELCPKKSPKAIETHHINVPTQQVLGPSFYLHYNQFFIFLDAEAVQEYLRNESQVTKDSLQLRLANDIGADLPLKHHEDLFKYVIPNATNRTYIERTVAHFLEHGRAVVLSYRDLWPGDETGLSRLVEYKVNSEPSGFRTFCSEDHDLIFMVLDWMS